MKAELAKKVIEALRSGRHNQVQGRLCDGYGNYCVMGLIAHEAGCPDHIMMGRPFQRFMPHELARMEMTPEEQEQLIKMNDKSGGCPHKTFEQFARLFEKNSKPKIKGKARPKKKAAPKKTQPKPKKKTWTAADHQKALVKALAEVPSAAPQVKTAEEVLAGI